jgi:hypothetical protein
MLSLFLDREQGVIMERMSTTSKFWITILLGIVGSVLSYGYVNLSSQGWLAQWTYLGVLPEKPVGFLTLSNSDTRDFTIEMVSGEIYRYESQTHSWWNVIDPPPGERYYLRCYRDSDTMLDPRTFPPLPTKIAACAQWSGEGFFGDIYYVIALEDGSVWTRAHKTDPSVLGCLCWDPLTSILIGWGIIRFVEFVRSRQSYWDGIKRQFAFIILGFGGLMAIFWLSRIIAPYASGILFAAFLYLMTAVGSIPPATCGLLFIVISFVTYLATRFKAHHHNSNTPP